MADDDIVIIREPYTLAVVQSTETDISIESPGPQGSTGPAGPTGAPGGEVLEFTQAAPATPWVITHSLETDYPDVTCIVSDEEVYPDVAYAPGIVTLTFAQPRAGKARLRP